MLRIREATHGNPLKNPTNKPLKFYSAWYCPFAQTAWMALLYKQLDFEYIEVDPYQKSQWWLEISRNSAISPFQRREASGHDSATGMSPCWRQAASGLRPRIMIITANA
ncbi:MAG: glutathione S-transferase N-terminal domain-containing protein [Candidatus Thiodiazotropha endolucinida]|nr:glutathione S-transferase N-terminal domain-containing protein [Candidatus Thiodiazotropha taylori]MCW4237943.1 glutathione S-transferase N-terminal domain-containing protein [Candidatus Thiodiazotropha endolucinida]